MGLRTNLFSDLVRPKIYEIAMHIIPVKIILTANIAKLSLFMKYLTGIINRKHSENTIMHLSTTSVKNLKTGNCVIVLKKASLVKRQIIEIIIVLKTVDTGLYPNLSRIYANGKLSNRIPPVTN